MRIHGKTIAIALALLAAFGFYDVLSSPRADVGAHPPDSTYGCGFDGDDPCHTPHAPRPATATPRPATATPQARDGNAQARDGNAYLH